VTDSQPPDSAGQGTEPDPRFTFANERTFLAWSRTALALVVAGAVGAPTASGEIKLSKLTMARTNPQCPEPKRRTLAVPLLTLKAAWRDSSFSAEPLQAELAKGTVSARLTASLVQGARVQLDDLAVKARTIGLEPIFQSTPSSKLVSVLGESEAGREFLADLRAYLDEYGLRTDMFDLHTPTWQEDPSFALSSVLPGVSFDRGMAYANRIHNTGQAVVWSGHQERAELPPAAR